MAREITQPKTKTLIPTISLKLHFFIGLALVAIFWTASWLHLGVLGEYAFFPLWLGYILTLDALVALRKGTSLLTDSPSHFISLFLLSAPVWWLFEAANSFTLNWHYLGAENYSRLQIILEEMVDFSIVVPAVFETTMLVLTFDFVRRFEHASFRVHVSRNTLWFLMYLGAFMFLAIILFPAYAFPFIWVWLLLLIDPLNWMRGRPSLLEQLSRGDFHLIIALPLATLVCGFFWEMWNFYSFPKWYYTVPYIMFAKIFEMPLIGYLGYIPFGWELYALYQFVWGALKLGEPHAFGMAAPEA
jgi:hypothetical protein